MTLFKQLYEPEFIACLEYEHLVAAAGELTVPPCFLLAKTQASSIVSNEVQHLGLSFSNCFRFDVFDCRRPLREKVLTVAGLEQMFHGFTIGYQVDFDSVSVDCEETFAESLARMDYLHRNNVIREDNSVFSD